MPNKRLISYDDFLAEVCRAPCLACSGYVRPSVGEATCKYDCQLRELIQVPVYPVWFVNGERTEFRNYDNPEAHAIRVEELAAMTLLVRQMLDKWYKADLGAITEASVVILHCTGCARRVLVDGVHRTIWLLNQGRTEIIMHVIELSRSKWPVGTPDLNIVCTCTRG
jgi:hypothetical protein